MGWLSRLFGGEDAETREARKRMDVDLRDPRRAFVWGIVAVSYDVDPGYLRAHATEAIRDWYGVTSAQDLLSRNASSFVANEHVAYNQFRLCFLARAGYGAGLVDEATSWDMAFRNAAIAQQHYAGWQQYGQGYLEGHLSYRADQGDSPERLSEIRNSISQKLQLKQRTVWSAIPWDARLV